MFTRPWRYTCAAALLVAVGTFSQSSHADQYYPGLPDPDGTTGNDYTSVAAGGMGYSALAKQWFRNPAGMVTTRTDTKFTPTGDIHVFKVRIHSQSFLVSPDGAPENYGYFAPVTVRSVGFGLMPVEATLQVSQRRSNGYPIPLEADLHGTEHYAVQPDGSTVRVDAVVDETKVDDAFNVDVLKVKIDGVDVGLKGKCRTVTPAPVHLIGKGYTIEGPEDGPWFAHMVATDPTGFFHPFYGGYMSGTITIPPFAGCKLATGEDISALLTKSASGPDNPIQATAGWVCDNFTRGQAKWPPAPGQSTPKKTDCEGVHVLPYPNRPS
jgi:hypothetical protein